MEVSYSSFRLKAELIRCVWAVGKVEIPLVLRDFQAEWKSPAVGLFRGASFSTAVLPTNCAKDPFIPGITGRLYQQFALTIAISVVLSAFNALTLSPALAALLLRPKKE